MTGGVKRDEGKPRVSLIPPEAIIEIAKVLTHGGAKYGDRNWEQGMDWSRPYDAMQRHMLAFWSGQDNDPETGLPHLAHACCSAMFLLTYMRTHRHLDNRPQSSFVHWLPCDTEAG